MYFGVGSEEAIFLAAGGAVKVWFSISIIVLYSCFCKFSPHVRLAKWLPSESIDVRLLLFALRNTIENLGWNCLCHFNNIAISVKYLMREHVMFYVIIFLIGLTVLSSINVLNFYFYAEHNKGPCPWLYFTVWQWNLNNISADNRVLVVSLRWSLRL